MTAQQLKNAILQEAIEGRLVKQDPNDEPASKLLERIRKEKQQLVKAGKLKKKDLEEKPISEDEIPFEIPESWEWVRFGYLINLLSGRDLAPQDYNSNKVGIPYMTGASNFENEELIVNRWTKNPMTISKKGDLLITCKGTIGTMAFNEIGDIHIARQIMAISSSYLDMCYVKYYLMRTVSELDKKAKSIIPGISREDLLEAYFPLPPLAEQQRIVAKIEELLPKVEEYGKAQEKLNKLNEELPERLKKSILQEAIEGRLVPQDSNDEPASVLLAKIREEKKQLVKAGKLKKKDLEEKPISEDEIPFEIPESWEWVRLGDISTYANTKKKINAANADPNLWGLDLEDIEKGGQLLSFKLVGERKAIGDKTCFSEGDILYSKLRPYLLKILIAPKDGICTPEIIPFICYGSINKAYIVNLLKSTYVDDYINSVTFGVKMPRVSTETMVSLVLPLPPLAEQHRIVAKIEELFKGIDKLKTK